ncbi:MAG TPA: isocitrate lyase/phosphoenolpyruvate mutase family protein [Phycisphaerales bacterium]|nr:isocitrate lyase/phosphoenolpyruvate mutase family protein [Phycisphaerales bacterium]
MTTRTPGQRFRDLMNQGCVGTPGAFNGLCARAIAQAGFQACYISGAATSVSAGVPDVGLLGLEHFCRCIREAADASGLPVLADADTGFGEAEMVRRTVIEYSRAGAAGLHLEDQKFPKRCGHLDGKELVPTDHMIEKVQWAAKARTACDPHFVVCARTDARGVDGFEAAVNRAAAYTLAGADMIFPEGLANEEEFALFAKAMQRLDGPAPRGGPYLLANMTEFGKTPIIPQERFAAMGYTCVIYPVSLLRVAMGAVTRALEQLKRDGSVSGFIDQMQTRQELYALTQYKPGTPWEFPSSTHRQG